MSALRYRLVLGACALGAGAVALGLLSQCPRAGQRLAETPTADAGIGSADPRTAAADEARTAAPTRTGESASIRVTIVGYPEDAGLPVALAASPIDSFGQQRSSAGVDDHVVATARMRGAETVLQGVVPRGEEVQAVLFCSRDGVAGVDGLNLSPVLLPSFVAGEGVAEYSVDLDSLARIDGQVDESVARGYGISWTHDSRHAMPAVSPMSLSVAADGRFRLLGLRETAYDFHCRAEGSMTSLPLYPNGAAETRVEVRGHMSIRFSLPADTRPLVLTVEGGGQWIPFSYGFNPHRLSSTKKVHGGFSRSILRADGVERLFLSTRSYGLSSYSIDELREHGGHWVAVIDGSASGSLTVLVAEDGKPGWDLIARSTVGSGERLATVVPSGYSFPVLAPGPHRLHWRSRSPGLPVSVPLSDVLVKSGQHSEIRAQLPSIEATAVIVSNWASLPPFARPDVLYVDGVQAEYVADEPGVFRARLARPLDRYRSIEGRSRGLAGLREGVIASAVGDSLVVEFGAPDTFEVRPRPVLGGTPSVRVRTRVPNVVGDDVVVSLPLEPIASGRYRFPSHRSFEIELYETLDDRSIHFVGGAIVSRNDHGAEIRPAGAWVKFENRSDHMASVLALEVCGVEDWTAPLANCEPGRSRVWLPERIGRVEAVGAKGAREFGQDVRSRGMRYP